jgi:hypothetical protein
MADMIEEDFLCQRQLAIGFCCRGTMTGQACFSLRECVSLAELSRRAQASFWHGMCYP